MGSSYRYQKMRGSILSILACIQVSQGAPPGFLNGLSNFLTSLTGGGNTGEVDDYENAPYTVIQKYDDYEERFYPSKMWVCTRNGGQNGGFMKLFGYISGENNRNQKIDMTVPVMMTYNEKGEEMCFYMTSSTQKNSPAPTNKDVYLSQKKDMTVYATTVGGYPNHATEAAKFKAVLQRGLASQVDFSTYIAMSYDSPMKFLNRRTDIAYMKI